MNIVKRFYLPKNDRQALLALLAITIVCLFLVFSISNSDEEKNISAQKDSLWHSNARLETNNQALIRQATRENPVYSKEEGSIHELFPFDPNTADDTTFKRLGLRNWQIRNILRFREKGGVFSRPSDFARVYGITKKNYEALLPFIRISDDYKQASEFYGNERYEHKGRKYTPYYNRESSYGKPLPTNTTAEKSKAGEAKVYSYPHKLKNGEHIAINAADTTDLMKIPGIGSYYARTIIKYRDRLGGFASIEQLKEIEGIPSSALSFIKIDANNIQRLNINKLSLNQLRQHPYLNYYQAKEICDYRRQKGPLKSLEELKLLQDFPPDEIERIKPYVCF